MILTDTGVWVDHFRKANPVLTKLLHHRQIYCHSYVLGELALGAIARRPDILMSLMLAPQVESASHSEVMYVIERHRLGGIGIGYVDASLIAATLLTPGTNLWTTDKKLRSVAEGLNISIEPI